MGVGPGIAASWKIRGYKVKNPDVNVKSGWKVVSNIFQDSTCAWKCQFRVNNPRLKENKWRKVCPCTAAENWRIPADFSITHLMGYKQELARLPRSFGHKLSKEKNRATRLDSSDAISLKIRKMVKIQIDLFCWILWFSEFSNSLFFMRLFTLIFKPCVRFATRYSI